MNPLKCYFALAIILMVSALANLISSACSAECHPQKQVVVQQQAVLFGVPVAVPVATVSPVAYGYSYAGAAGAYTNSASYRSAQDDFAELVASKLEARLLKSGGQVAALDSPDLIAQHCSKCHAGPNAQGGFNLSQLSTAEGRLLALERMSHPDESLRMPKGPPLAPGEVGKLIYAVSSLGNVSSTAKATATSKKPPAVPVPK